MEGTQLKAWLVLAAQKWEATSPQDVGPFDHLPTFQFHTFLLASQLTGLIPFPSRLSQFLAPCLPSFLTPE